jgi:hypothetical protein
MIKAVADNGAIGHSPVAKVKFAPADQAEIKPFTVEQVKVIAANGHVYLDRSGEIAAAFDRLHDNAKPTEGVSP